MDLSDVILLTSSENEASISVKQPRNRQNVSVGEQPVFSAMLKEEQLNGKMISKKNT